MFTMPPAPREMRPDFANSELSDPRRKVVEMGQQTFSQDVFLCALLECGHVAPVGRWRAKFDEVPCHACRRDAGECQCCLLTTEQRRELR